MRFSDSSLSFAIFLFFIPEISVKKCRDKIDNVITINSYGKEKLPVAIKNITILVYDHKMKPSCYKKKVNVVLPGYFVITGGQIITSRDFDVISSGPVSVSVSMDGDHICLNGHSDMFIVPDSLCNFEMCSFVPMEICKILEMKGIHSLEELQKKVDFNSTLELPPSPSFLGVSLLDIMKGNYRIKISISSKNEKIAEFAIPTGYVDLKMGLSEDEDD